MKAILVVDIDDSLIEGEDKFAIDGYLMQESDCVGCYEAVGDIKNAVLKPVPKELVYEGHDSPNKQICEAILHSEWGKKAKKSDVICKRSFSIGYNACLEEITREQNEERGV